MVSVILKMSQLTILLISSKTVHVTVPKINIFNEKKYLKNEVVSVQNNCCKYTNFSNS